MSNWASTNGWVEEEFGLTLALWAEGWGSRVKGGEVEYELYWRGEEGRREDDDEREAADVEDDV